MYLARGMSQAEAEKRADKIMPLLEKALKKRPKCECFSAFDEWTNYYLMKGFRRKEAQKLAKKLLKKLDARIKYEHLEFIPLFLLEKSGEGIHLYYGNTGRFEQFKNRVHRLLYRWSFLTQWRATFWQSFKRHRLLWIGRGNPVDYTLACSACTKAGDCAVGAPCSVVDECRENFTCYPVCPAPSVSHSHAESNTCVCSKTGCACTSKKCAGTNSACAVPSGICGYHCDPPYVWNGVACVEGVTTKLWMTLKGRGGDALQRLRGRKTLKGFLSMISRS